MPEVSVVIPTFNSAMLVREAIKTALVQTYRDFEIIVVDDGSIDNTGSVIAQFGSDVHYFRQQNRGSSAARNQGIAISRGNYIAFLDADDLWTPNKLAEQIPIFQRDSKIGLVYSDWAVTSEGGETRASRLRDLSPGSGYVFDDLIQCGFILTSGTVVRRSCLNEVGYFDERLSIAQDYDLWLRICYRWKVELVNKVLVTKRDRNGNLSSNLVTTARERIALFDKALTNFTDMTPPTRRLIKDQLAYNHWDVGYHNFDRLLLREARKSFASSLSYQRSARALGYLAATFLPSSVVRVIRTAKRAGDED
jgi:glycosyltransferase involved in cell wall biosynthesis